MRACRNAMVLEPLESRRLFSGAAGVDGIAVLGDSYSDEYQFYPPARATASNWVEQLAKDSKRELRRVFQR